MIAFSTSGTCSVWSRRYTIGGASNSCWVGLDGVGNGSNDYTGDANQWSWKSLRSIDVTAGLHTFNLRRRESAFKVDRIVLTTDGVAEAMNFQDEPYGRQRLRESILRNRALDASQHAGQLLWYVRRFVGLADPSADIPAVAVTSC